MSQSASYPLQLELPADPRIVRWRPFLPLERKSLPSGRRNMLMSSGPTPRIKPWHSGGVKRPIRAALRRLTQVTRPLAMRSAGTETSGTSIVRHVGRRSGRTYQTPVVAAEHDENVLIALPYGEGTDWAKNVLASGKATVVTQGRTYGVDQPQVIPMTDATTYFGPKEQKLHRRFAVDTCLRVHRV